VQTRGKAKLTSLANWLTNLQDSDSIVDSLFKQCHEAGPVLCPLYHDSLEKIKSAYTDTLAALKVEPLSIPADDNYGPDIYTYHEFANLIIPVLYSPTIFPAVSAIIKQIVNGNTTGFTKAKELLFPETCRSSSCQRHPWSSACHEPDLVSTPLQQSTRLRDSLAWREE
jgi:hypothetical protein